MRKLVFLGLSALVLIGCESVSQDQKKDKAEEAKKAATEKAEEVKKGATDKAEDAKKAATEMKSSLESQAPAAPANGEK